MPGAVKRFFPPTKKAPEPAAHRYAGNTVEPPEQDDALSRLPAGPLKNAHLTPTGILALQRTAGNQAVMRLLASRKAAGPSTLPAAAIQRKIEYAPLLQEGNTITGTLTNSTWTRLTDTFSTYR